MPIILILEERFGVRQTFKTFMDYGLLVRKGGRGNPVAQNTKFGWILSGKVGTCRY